MAHDSKDKDRLLSRLEVEDLFGIPKRFLEKSAQTGEGPIRVYVGRLVRYRVDDIRAWIASNARGGTE
jgi:predicted DNA-binding transcriptional regulator AlpA